MIHHGDCIEVMRGMPDASVDSIVTDPPYGLGFMGKAWDELPPGEEWARECLRVLKPGGYLLAFGGSRTYHRLASAVEDGGFEIRDCITWHFGSGFPKSLNVTDALGRIVPADARCACGPRSTRTPQGSQAGYPSSHGSGDAQPRSATGNDRAPAPSLDGARARTHAGQRAGGQDEGLASSGPGADTAHPSTGGSPLPSALRGATGPLDASALSDKQTSTSGAPASEPRRTEPHIQHTFGSGDDSARHKHMACSTCDGIVIPQGLGTALKPATEFIVVARKPLAGTVAANVLAHGTGALNVDGCRIDGSGKKTPGSYSRFDTGSPIKAPPRAPDGLGRWPANVVLDEEMAGALDEQSGVTVSTRRGTHNEKERPDGTVAYGRISNAQYAEGSTHADSGGASRFFYVAKASRRERPTYAKEGGGETALLDQKNVRECNVCSSRAKPGGPLAGRAWPSCGHEDWSWVKEHRSAGGAHVAHPTVKPLALMRWLVRLVTPPGGTVLDPFAGSGTTIEAALLEGFQPIGIEREADYLPLIEARIARVTDVPMEMPA